MNFLEEKATLSQLSYFSETYVKNYLKDNKLTDVSFYETEGDVQCFFAKNKDDLYLVFRGTSNFTDCLTDLKFNKTEFCGFSAHAGFVGSANEVKELCLDYVSKNFTAENMQFGGRIFVLGHSMGGAIAYLITAFLLTKDTFWSKSLELITFGSPRVFGFNLKLRSLFQSIACLRVHNGDDIVTNLPMAILNYSHYGKEIFVGSIDSDNSLEEHKITNYIASIHKLGL